MVFTKPLDYVVFDDIKKLEQNETHESDILDYKEALIDDDSLTKSVSSFANTKGGYMVFGIVETGKGGYPKAIPGLDSGTVNKERLEQIVLSNIDPRLSVKITAVPHEEPEKSILIIQIPDSHLKPHMNLRDRRYYRRYNFEAEPMTEAEVSEAYKSRFVTYREVDGYIRELLSKHDPRCKVWGQIIIIPAVTDRRMVDTYDGKSYSWLDPNRIDPQPSGIHIAPQNDYVPGSPEPSPRGIVCIRYNPDVFRRYLEIHRNGCVEYGDDFASSLRDVRSGEQTLIFDDAIFCVKLLHTLQFAATVYSRYNYFGHVKIIASLRDTSNLYLQFRDIPLERQKCASPEIIVEREFPSTMLETEFSWIAASIMHEIFNHFGIWRCGYFDVGGGYIIEKLAT